MKTKIAFVFLFVLFGCLAAEELTPIFNGKDLSGWKVPENNVYWKVKDGELVGNNDPKKRGSMLWTEKKYKNFIIELEFKMGEGTIDSGVFLRNDDQIQIGISSSLKRDMTASPYIPKKKYPKEADVKDILKAKEWNKMKIQAAGNVYTVWLNDKQVMEYTSDTAIAEGPIGLQIHPGKEMEIFFRNINVKETP